MWKNISWHSKQVETENKLGETILVSEKADIKPKQIRRTKSLQIKVKIEQDIVTRN